MGNIGTWQLVIIALLILLLFGAKRLPDMARGLGRSLKIFKTETQGLVSGDDDKDKETAPDTSAQTQAPAPKAVEQQQGTQARQPQQGEVVNDAAQQRDA